LKLQIFKELNYQKSAMNFYLKLQMLSLCRLSLQRTEWNRAFSANSPLKHVS